MPKNIKGGNKTKSQKNSSGEIKKNREIAVPETSDDSHVSVITKILGDSRYTADILNSTGIQKTGIIVHLSSTVKKKYGSGIILTPGSYVLVTIRETDQGKKGDIIFLYRDSEISFLIENKHMPAPNTDSALGDFEFSDSYSLSNNNMSLSDDSISKVIYESKSESITENISIDFDAI